ncbi:Ion channel [Dictyocaulus viviparus]|uniref:Ion channel n=1 Tax=Dictyocaulus viviparus TaxID=29172 RepID=A0A0D8XQ27_DICVI|nr:Ion channel [Dictyocaulus viviparus]
MENDQRNREGYRNRIAYAMNQVLERMLEVRCHDSILGSADKAYQRHVLKCHEAQFGKHSRASVARITRKTNDQLSNRVKHAKDALLWFLDHLNLTEVLNERTEDTPWTWLGSMFYAGQLYTTIGYGYPITRTVAGRVTSIFYILFGIPIFLIILKVGTYDRFDKEEYQDIGRLMSRGCRKLYKHLGDSQRRMAKIPMKTVSQCLTVNLKGFQPSNSGKVMNGQQSLKDTEMDPEHQNKVNARRHAENAFPIPIALAMLFLWILFSAGLFCLWEREWGYLTSVYFFFVSISTVGLGDIVFINPDMMIFNFLLILIGLALLSMCFNLIQIRDGNFY